MASISLKYKSKSGNLTAPGDVDPGAMIPIATTTLSTSTATITFSNIPQEYQHLQIRGIGRSTATQSFAGLRLRVGSGSVDTGGNYSTHLLYGDGSSAISQGYSSTSETYMGTLSAANDTANAFGVAVFDFLDYANTNIYKTVRVLQGVDTNGTGYVHLNSAGWRSTSAINTISLYPSGGNFAQYSSFALYGIKRAGA